MSDGKIKKGKGDKNRIEGIVFVPCTPRGVLVKELQLREDKFAKLHGLKRVKFVEKGGLKISEQIVKKDPWANKEFGRPECIVQR